MSRMKDKFMNEQEYQSQFDNIDDNDYEASIEAPQSTIIGKPIDYTNEERKSVRTPENASKVIKWLDELFR